MATDVHTSKTAKISPRGESVFKPCCSNARANCYIS